MNFLKFRNLDGKFIILFMDLPFVFLNTVLTHFLSNDSTTILLLVLFYATSKLYYKGNYIFIKHNYYWNKVY